MADPWGFLILRSMFFGKRRFSDIQEHGAIPKKILAARLKGLGDAEVIRRRKYQARPARFEYLLTDKGHELYAPAIALLHWGDTHMSDGGAPPVRLRHATCGRRFHAVVTCSECRAALNIRDVTWRDGPGAGYQPRSDFRRHRRSPSPDIYQRGRPCSVARTLSVIADRWSFLVMREACFGTRRFEAFHERTGIARNILTDRLQSLVGNGLLERRRYEQAPERFEYRLAGKGRALYPPILTLMAWGDKWLSGRKGPPVLLSHKTCGRDFQPVVLCSSCGEAIRSRDVSYDEAPAAEPLGSSKVA